MCAINAVGIIAEYNPFHNGHQWHVNEAKKMSGCPYAIAVMSGNFVQRGEPAIFDKWLRAEMAVRGGVDLVIELPVVFTVRSAQYFASGGVRLLDSLKVVSHISFGAENADLSALAEAAQTAAATESPVFRNYLATGYTYAAALAKSLESSKHDNCDIVTRPNNILAIEYLRAIRQYGSKLVPVAISRKYAQYHDTAITSAIASATAIRKALETEQPLKEAGVALPETSEASIKQIIAAGRGPVSYDSLSDLILYRLRTASLNEVESLPDVSEGLHHKILASARPATSIEELLRLVKSKRYTRTRLQRIMIHALLGTNKTDIAAYDASGPLYARVLAFNSNGRKLLKSMQEQSTVTVITKTTHALNSKQQHQGPLSLLQQMLSLDTLASDVYMLGIPNPQWKLGGVDFRHAPVYTDHVSPTNS